METKVSKEKKVKTVKTKVCPICGREYTGYGNNASPLAYNKPVCDECNCHIVIPVRYLMLKYQNSLGK